MPAREAPLCWRPCAAASLIDAIAERARDASAPDLALADLASARHVVLGPTGEEFVILRDSHAAVTLSCRGCPVARCPINLALLNRLSSPDASAKAMASLADLILRPRNAAELTRMRLLRRDGLIALDGKRLGASYRDIAIAIYGLERVKAEWVSASRWMKDYVCRLYAKGKKLRDGGFRDLLRLGCRFG